MNSIRLDAGIEVQPHLTLQTRLIVTLSSEARDFLLENFSAFLSDPAMELKIELPSNWTLYFKCKRGQARLFLAKPQAGVWVGSAEIDPEHGERVRQAIAALTVGAVYSIAESEAVHPLSNLDLVFRFAA